MKKKKIKIFDRTMGYKVCMHARITTQHFFLLFSFSEIAYILPKGLETKKFTD